MDCHAYQRHTYPEFPSMGSTVVFLIDWESGVQSKKPSTWGQNQHVFMTPWRAMTIRFVSVIISWCIYTYTHVYSPPLQAVAVSCLLYIQAAKLCYDVAQVKQACAPVHWAGVLVGFAWPFQKYPINFPLHHSWLTSSSYPELLYSSFSGYFTKTFGQSTAASNA